MSDLLSSSQLLVIDSVYCLENERYNIKAKLLVKEYIIHLKC